MLKAFAVFLISVAFKLLFIFSYRSTDFEVHRNWLAITHSLPVSQWYFESTSKWTLDYPPFFAWFEWVLSHVAALIDPAMCAVTKLPYVSSETIVFQRCTVVCSELVLFLALWKVCLVLSRKGSCLMKRRFVPTISIFALNFGLIVVDHIHFQYNGFLFGVYFLSVSLLIEERYLASATCFTFLLYLKHLFMYIAPVYFVYILFNYCLASRKQKIITSFTRLFLVGLIVTSVSFLAFLPFRTMAQMRQIYSRLFPFDRGLTHAYWAPNFWALYNTAERILCASHRYLNLSPGSNVSVASMTRGLVGEIDYVALPKIRTWYTFALSSLGMLPHLIRCACKSTAFHPTATRNLYTTYLETIVAAAWSCFLFGWHVHEKAILMVLLPLNLLAIALPEYREITFYVTTVGHFSLIPLIPTSAEAAAVVFTFLTYTGLHWLILFRLLNTNKECPSNTNGSVRSLALLHLCGLSLVYFCGFIIWPWTNLMSRLPFLPLMVTSAYCALGLSLAFLFYLRLSIASKIKWFTVVASSEHEKGSIKKLKSL